tara:strand:- start:1897 stop:2334 length:438 start_codon:yes stop_codon:yes gene_type:complete
MAQKVEMRNKKYGNYSEPESDSDEEEFPCDTFFYGSLDDKVVSLDELSVIMTKGLKKFKDYMLEKEGEEMLPEDLCHTLDLWCQHDSERNNYFDHLIDNPVSFDDFSVNVITNIEDQEQKEITTTTSMNNRWREDGFSINNSYQL